MNLTEKELEIMDVLWENKVPMTAVEMINKGKGTKSWSNRSIYTFLQYLEKKGAIRIARTCPINERYGKAYEPTVSLPEYIVETAAGINRKRSPAIRISADECIKLVKDMWDDE